GRAGTSACRSMAGNLAGWKESVRRDHPRVAADGQWGSIGERGQSWPPWLHHRGPDWPPSPVGRFDLIPLLILVSAHRPPPSPPLRLGATHVDYDGHGHADQDQHAEADDSND